jgi:hypothetical protein
MGFEEPRETESESVPFCPRRYSTPDTASKANRDSNRGRSDRQRNCCTSAHQRKDRRFPSGSDKKAVRSGWHGGNRPVRNQSGTNRTLVTFHDVTRYVFFPPQLQHVFVVELPAIHDAVSHAGRVDERFANIVPVVRKASQRFRICVLVFGIGDWHSSK